MRSTPSKDVLMEAETDDKTHRSKLAILTTVVIVLLAGLAVFLGRRAMMEPDVAPEQPVVEALTKEPTSERINRGPMFIDGKLEGAQALKDANNVMVYTVGWVATHPSEFFEREVELKDMKVTRVINADTFYVRPMRDIDAPEILVRTKGPSKTQKALQAGAVVGLKGIIRDARQSDPMADTKAPSLQVQKAISDDLIYIDVDEVQRPS